MRKIFFLPILFFTSCEFVGVKENMPPSQPADTTRVVLKKTENNDFISILKEINISNINEYIHPKNGLRIINSSGAMPNMTNTSQVDKNFPVDFSTVKNEELPKINCDSTPSTRGWTMDGCFAQEINNFQNEKIWTFCGLSKEDEVKVAELAKTISWTVINTSLNARYYFSKIDGKWYLAFVDLRRPCEA